MVLTVEGLKLSIDASGMEEGARIGVAAAKSITDASKEAAKSVDDLSKGSAKSAETMKTKVAPAATEVATSMDRVSEHSERTRASLFSVEGIGERVGESLRHLAKAAIAFVAVDIAAKVFGFNDAMDALRKGTDALAESIQHALNPRMDELKARADLVAASIDKIAKAQEALNSKASANVFTVPGFNQTKYTPQGSAVNVNVGDTRFNLGALADNEGLMRAALSKIDETAKEMTRLSLTLNSLNTGSGAYASTQEGFVGEITAIEKAAAKAIDDTKAFVDSLVAMSKAEDEAARKRKARGPGGIYGPFEDQGYTGKELPNVGQLPYITHPDFVGPPSPDHPNYEGQGVFGGGGGYARQADKILYTQMEEIDARSQQLIEVAKGIGDAFGSAFEDAVLGAKTFGDAIKGLAMDIERTLVHNLLSKPFGDWISGLVAGSGTLPQSGGQSAQFGLPGAFGAKGMILRGGDVIPFANGGIFNSPTYFPMSGGRTGMLGEAGPEAIVPLKPDRNGKLGIASEGRVINFNVYTNDADSFGRSSRQIMNDLQRIGR